MKKLPTNSLQFKEGSGVMAENAIENKRLWRKTIGSILKPLNLKSFLKIQFSNGSVAKTY